MNRPTLAGFARGIFDACAITAALVVPPWGVIQLFRLITG